MLKTCYSPRYFAHTPTNSMEKLTAIADVLIEHESVEIVEPDLIDTDILRQLHDPTYVDAFLVGQRPLALMQGFRKWNEQLRDAVLSVNQGQILAADIAFKEGIAANIAQGFHHATYEYGNAFCTFNGLALISMLYPDKKIFILDCDQHGGDGTSQFTKRYENLFNFSICGLTFRCEEGERSIVNHIHPKTGSFESYIAKVHEGIAKAKEWGADLIIYQAGADCHQKDPFGSAWFTKGMMYERDFTVFENVSQMGIPLMFVLAGGYQQMETLVPLHVNTFKAANMVYFNKVD